MFEYHNTSSTQANQLAEEEEETVSSSNTFNMIIFSSLTVVMSVFAYFRMLHINLSCLKSSIKLHNSMFYKIIRAPCRFFDINPIGRIFNR